MKSPSPLNEDCGGSTTGSLSVLGVTEPETGQLKNFVLKSVADAVVTADMSPNAARVPASAAMRPILKDI